MRGTLTTVVARLGRARDLLVSATGLVPARPPPSALAEQRDRRGGAAPGGVGLFYEVPSAIDPEARPT
ncbi:MAG: hypothetical protein ACRDZX_16400 [Acidimicrobiales bacterium]